MDVNEVDQIKRPQDIVPDADGVNAGITVPEETKQDLKRQDITRLDGRVLTDKDLEVYRQIEAIVYDYYNIKWDKNDLVYHGEMLDVANNKIKGAVRLIINL